MILFCLGKYYQSISWVDKRIIIACYIRMASFLWWRCFHYLLYYCLSTKNIKSSTLLISKHN